MNPLAWMDSAACKGVDPNLFHPAAPGRGYKADPEPALEYCRRCSVTDECYAYALEIHADIGIWGGRYFGMESRKSITVGDRKRPAHACERCGAETTNVKWCSKACQVPAVLPRKCAGCDVLFTPAKRGHAGIYCSRDCYRQRNWANDNGNRRTA